MDGVLVMSGSQKLSLKNGGVNCFPNPLSSVPDGSALDSLNTVIDRDSVVEPRRGFSQYGSTFGLPTDTIKQLINYKDVIFRHVLSKLQFDADVNGDFRDIVNSDTNTEEVTTGYRIKSQEVNGNLYLATRKGIKKISARNRLDCLTVPMEDAGGPKGLDIEAKLNFTSPGWLEPNSKAAYRVVFGKKDLNENLILGAPSAPAVVYNFSTSSCFVDLSFTLPADVTTQHFYQIYRTGLSTSTPPIEPGDPGDEMNLIFEENITTSNITAKKISTTDITPEDFRRSGTLLYTNPVSGEGILQANEKPPFARDIATYKNYTFYANTSTVQRLNFSILTIEGIVSSSSTITVSNNTGTNTVYTFQGTNETFTADFTGAASSDLYNTTSGPAKYFTIASAGDERKYYVWIYQSVSDLDPGPLVAALSGFVGIKVVVNPNKQTVTASSTGTAVTLATAPSFTVKVGDTLEANSQLRTITAVASQTSVTINAAFAPDLASVPTLVTSVDSVSTIRTKISDAILASTDDFNITVPTTPAQILIACANNGAVTTSVESPGNGVLTENITNFTITSNNAGTGEDAGIAKKIFLPRVPIGAENGPTVSQQLEQVAKSMIRVINAQDPLVAGYYQSNYTSVPGQMLLEGRNTVGPIFYLFSNVGTNFTPTIPTNNTAQNQVFSTNETRPNRIVFSKLQQPEAVPLVNYIDIGPKDRAINRIIALRESLFIFKEDGIYRLSGDTAPFIVSPFDFSVQVLAPDTAVVLNNQIYALSTQGVIVVTDTGVSVISRPIENLLLNIIREGFNYKEVCFGVSYESDRSFHLWAPTTVNDTYATQCFRYNTFTNSWTRWDKNAKAGVVNFGDNKLYLAPGDINQVEKERKTLTRIDYADREYQKDILVDGVLDGFIDLDSVDNVAKGDVMIQRQYLTASQFNRLLQKLDDDQLLLAKNYISTLKVGSNQVIRNAVENLANKLDLDANLTFNNYFSLINNYSHPVTSVVNAGTTAIINVTGPHSIKVGRYVKFANVNTFPLLNSTYKVTAVALNSLTIEASLISILALGTSPIISTAIEDSKDSQGCYNLLTANLNLDLGANFVNYPTISGYVDFETNIDSVNRILNRISVSENQLFFVGPVVLYSAINSQHTYNPQFFGDPSLDKQVREGSAMFENSNFSTMTMSYASDKFPSFVDTVFERPGVGDFGQFSFGQGVNFGGIAAPIPLRTYVPLEKQRCRFLVVKLSHKVAFEKWSLFGISLTFRGYNIRSNK